MVRSPGSLGFAVLALCAIAIGGCASPAAQECGATGIFCPAGTHCAAAQGICLPDTNTCGNAHLDPGEACDDGNTNDGDGCSHDCLSDETCGNGTIDLSKGEVCDDKNTVSGDGCSADCKSDETCGNKIVDTALGEVCDDGNDIIGDGCSHNCQSLEVCGNGIRDPGEACDLIPQDLSRCSADCKSTLQCGNGEVDPNEECDVLGLDDDTSDCRSDCVINRCGDGFVNTTVRLGATGPVEQCDGADPNVHRNSLAVTPTETAACNVDCTLASCGDGKLNRLVVTGTAGGHDLFEQCDDGASNADTGACTTNCQLARCGDSQIEAGVEDCDDGPGNGNSAACTANCKTATCGDGLVRAGVEQCDDGNLADNDGCSSGCVIERCGDHIQNNHEACDDGVASAGCNANCTVPSCGDGIVNPMFSPSASGTEQCDPPNPGGGCSAQCRFERCGNGVRDPGEDCDNGTNLVGSGCFECHFEVCGNGFLDVGEQCDDGNTSDTDGCISSNAVSANCKFARCGDGHVEAGTEDCDTGPLNGTVIGGCSNDCHVMTCGNGILEPGEECDDGNPSDDDDCLTGSSVPASCKIATCGDGKVDALNGREQCDTGPLNGTIVGGCSATCQTMSCGNGVIDFGEQCDDGAADNAPGKRCNASCQLNVCGDGDKLVGVEQCDDGLHDNATGTNTPRDTAACDSDCTFPVCGDNHQNAAFNEACDSGTSNSNTGACTLDCQLADCGDGFVQPGEQCDDPTHATSCAYNSSQTTCTVCDASCHSVAGTAHFCGDGIADAPFEVCDDNNPSCGSCSANCKVVQLAAAEGFIFAAAGPALNTGATNDRFTLSDGFRSVTFEFSATTVDPGNLKISVSPSDTNANMATKIANSINISSGLDIAASASGAVVVLENNRLSSVGNGGPENPARLTEQVVTQSFGIVDMFGGEGGDCGINQPCGTDDDCASGHCQSSSHTCQP